MTGNCAHYRPQILLLRDADRSGAAPSDVVDHLDQCELCRAEYRDLASFEENLAGRLAAGGVMTSQMDDALREQFRHVVRGRPTRRFGLRVRPVLATAAAFLLAVVLTFVLSPDPSQVRGSIYLPERDGATTTSQLPVGTDYHLILGADQAADLVVVHFDGAEATVIYPYPVAPGEWDYLGYEGGHFAAGETRIVPSLDSGASYAVEPPSGRTEHFLVVSLRSGGDDSAIDRLAERLRSVATVDRVRAIVRGQGAVVESFTLSVE